MKQFARSRPEVGRLQPKATYPKTLLFRFGFFIFCRAFCVYDHCNLGSAAGGAEMYTPIEDTPQS
jgi:hypothetical protein